MKNLYLLLFILVAGCQSNVTKELKSGSWRLTLDLGNAKELPVLIEVTEESQIILINDKERIKVEDISIKGDSITFQPPIFEGIFKGVFVDEITIKGDFIKPSLDRVVPFTMQYGDQHRFQVGTKEPTTNITGKWETVFSPDSDEDRYIALGIFNQYGQHVTGTFRTTTGDYRYLDGVIEGDQLKLSTFDGAHAFLFEATVTDSTLYGIFYSGNHWQEPFTAQLNNTYELPDAKELTFLKEGYEQLDFSFKDSDGTSISLSDSQFENKVVLVQLLGSWCPNCMEETQFYVDYLKTNPDTDVQIIGLAFEYARTEEKAFQSIERMKKQLEIPYPVLLAQYGNVDKKVAQEKLPMLNHVLSYPTTIYIDKNGKVRRIHTGFNGKATGDSYLKFKDDFYLYLDSLSAE
ncbi:peroxiredoxin family protein [Nonlabens ulvanivorans]|uniref:peroxiredoxin family protein n=1 Tax=Nonlabens ulvanivorans TaxID=906888 RepID=UPI00294279E0|nr:TlpA disulfide reductase family protein [Nonlabens ulvanivorans]WOI23861.1 TlpA disulfide reductase family protein [Nonlabens ulvanivorans]